MVKINKQILSQKADNVPGRSMTPKYITVHNTANATKGANAKMHANYQSNGSGGRQASWHYQVDDKEVWQSLEDNQQGWHSGDGKGKGNTQSIGIEICENSDGNFNKAVANAQALIKQLMDKHNIPLKNVVTHKHWSGKNCPRKLLDTWDNFKVGIDTGVSASTDKHAPSKPKPSTSTQRGVATVIVPSLNLRDQPSTKGKVIRKLSKGEAYKVWDEKNGWLRVGKDMWASWQNGAYMNWTEKPNKVASKPKPKTVNVGQKVKIKSSAKNYTRTPKPVAIPAKYKNKSLTIQQVGKDDVLIKELVSWVKKTDVQ